MLDRACIKVVIPALNEASSVGRVIGAVPDWVDEIVVADNGSTDGTADVARAAGARVVYEPRRGYGQACLAALAQLGPCDVIVFLDGDFSDHPEQMHRLVAPIVGDRADLVIGSRTRGPCEAGALTPQQRFGNRLACGLIRLIWNAGFTDLGPFRAIRSTALARLEMRDRNYGWTVEMQVKAAGRRLRVCEVPVRYRKRLGRSKISGTVRGVLGAGTIIPATILRAALTARPDRDVMPTDEDAHDRAATDALVVLTRYPVPGRTKTRLIPALGPQGAADLHAELVEHTLCWVDRLRRDMRVRVEIAFAGGSQRVMAQWLGPQVAYRAQGAGDLGVRIREAFDGAFRAGMERVVVVGTDCPGLTDDIVHHAFEHLADHDVALGPATDGGYYLIGLSKPAPALFTGLAWGSEDVLARTLEIAEQRGLSVARLEPLDDVDRPEDLHVWRASARR